MKDWKEKWWKSIWNIRIKIMIYVSLRKKKKNTGILVYRVCIIIIIWLITWEINQTKKGKLGWKVSKRKHRKLWYYKPVIVYIIYYNIS